MNIQKNKQIAIFGGAFDPPHLGHKFVADSLINSNIVDEVWFAPVFKHPWADRYDKRKLVDYDLRVEMLEAMIGEEADGGVSAKQKVAHFKDVSFTYDTLIYFQKKHPEYTFSWVMGSEYLGRFDDFLAGHPKLLDFHFYIYPRAGCDFDQNLLKENMTFLEDMEEIEVSSTEVKQRIKSGLSIESLVSEEVEEIIKENRLFVK
jgi:nicotinate-nucleotide adenylyltransferase